MRRHSRPSSRLTPDSLPWSANPELPFSSPAGTDRIRSGPCRPGRRRTTVGDMRFAEPTVLVSVRVRGGAEYVTAARWPLPTDTGFALVAGTGVPAFSSAVNAVDAGHEVAGPVAALGAWQREQAGCWARSGSLEYSPLVWGAFATTWAPPRIMAR